MDRKEVICFSVKTVSLRKDVSNNGERYALNKRCRIYDRERHTDRETEIERKREREVREEDEGARVM